MRCWRAVLALAVAASFMMVLGVSATHHHESSLDSHNCSVCAVLMDELPAVGALPALQLASVATSYFLRAAVRYDCCYRSPQMLPHSCGPPARACDPDRTTDAKNFLPSPPRGTHMKG